MGKVDVLDRVTHDLARGHTQPAIQRLGSLVARHPTDLDLRHRLAAVYRGVGNKVQAGRWDYLTVGADEAELAAFERAYPTASARLRELRWPGPGTDAPTEYARQRLTALRDEAGPVAPSRRDRPQWSWSVAAFTVVVVLVALLVAVGAVTVVQWLS